MLQEELGRRALPAALNSKTDLAVAFVLRSRICDSDRPSGSLASPRASSPGTVRVTHFGRNTSMVPQAGLAERQTLRLRNFGFSEFRDSTGGAQSAGCQRQQLPADAASALRKRIVPDDDGVVNGL